MSARPAFYTMPISHYCVSAERMLAFKGIAVRPVPVRYDDKRQLIRETGQDYVPALRWDGRVVTWEQIPEFLERQQPRPSLYPSGQRALAETLEHWGHQILEERVWRYVVTKVPAVLHDDAERWIFEEMQTRARGPWALLERRRGEFRKDMVSHLRRVEALVEDRDWILGEPSLADFGIYGSLSPLFTIGERLPAGLPRLAEWCRRIQALSA